MLLYMPYSASVCSFILICFKESEKHLKMLSACVEKVSTGFAVFVLRRFVCEKTFVLKKETYVIIDNMIILFIVSWFEYWCRQFVF